MADLHVDFLGKRLAGPVVAASGTFGFGPEYAGIEDLRVLGGISGKGLTLNGQPGNEGERLYETPSGLMNSIGLQNPGVQHFIDCELPAMRRCGTVVLLTARPEVILARVRDSDERPLLQGKKNVADIAALMAQRRVAYEAAADVTVDTSDLTIEAVCRAVLRQIDRK